jgi:hypothetical protein
VEDVQSLSRVSEKAAAYLWIRRIVTFPGSLPPAYHPFRYGR